MSSQYDFGSLSSEYYCSIYRIFMFLSNQNNEVIAMKKNRLIIVNNEYKIYITWHHHDELK